MEPKTELQQNALNEARRKDLEIFQRAMDIQWINNRMEDGRMSRRLAVIKREAEMEKDFQERTDHAAIVNARVQKEKDLAIAIAEQRREESCELLRRYYLRERDPELRELIKKLQAGYVCRDLREQILQNEYRRLQEKEENRMRDDVILKSVSEQDARIKEEEEKIASTSKYRKELQQQMVNKQRQKQCQYEDSLVEKRMNDDIMRTLADEDQRELKQKHDLTETLRREMKAFQQARLAWKQKQKEIGVAEEKAIEAQQLAMSDRSSGLIAAKKQKLLEMEQRNEKIGAKVMAEKAAILERENIIKQLQEQEYLEMNAQADINEKENTERTKNETKTMLTEQMETKKRAIAEQKLRDLEFRKLSEEKIKQEDEKERAKEAAYKKKQIQYSIDLKKQIEANSKKRVIEKEREDNRAKRVFESEKEWLKETHGEREKIVKEHAPRVIGYLQPGVIKKKDLPAIKEGVKEANIPDLDIDALISSKEYKTHPKCNAQCRVLREY